MTIIHQYFEPSQADNKITHTHTLIRNCDMVTEMKTEALEMCATALEDHPSNNELAAKSIKSAFDKKFGKTWHAVVGEGIGFDITYEEKNLLYFFDSGHRVILIWKNS